MTIHFPGITHKGRGHEHRDVPLLVAIRSARTPYLAAPVYVTKQKKTTHNEAPHMAFHPLWNERNLEPPTHPDSKERRRRKNKNEDPGEEPHPLRKAENSTSRSLDVPMERPCHAGAVGAGAAVGS
ncbi:hypothetical protein INR49_024541 [Caranx melampygus]|nr:hypothetical protein INR49_024541 [Caranx melampygus]